MNCERCHQRPAVVHITEIVNNSKKTLHLCEKCAAEMQAQAYGIIFPTINLHNLLAGMFNKQGGALPGPDLSNLLICPKCGLGEEQFSQTGLLGCGECYAHFSARLKPVIRRLHGAGAHTGKVPSRTGGRVKVVKEIDRLKLKLKEAVAREEFEDAATMRDRIRELEKELEGERS